MGTSFTRRIVSLSSLFLAVGFSNCAYYSFSPSVSGELKTIAVPLFENQTQEFGITEALTQGIIDRFIQDNSLKVISPDRADAILLGTITGYERKPYTFDQQENVKEYIIRIYVKAWLERAKNKDKIWEAEKIEGWGTFRIAGESNNSQFQPETEELGRQRAIAKLAEDIVNKTVKSW